MASKKNHPDLIAEVDGDFNLIFSIPKMLKLHLRTIGEGVKVRVEIVKWYKKRSGKQNSYLWAVVYPTIIAYILESTGQKFTAEDIHERYKRKLLGFDRCELMPDLIKVKSSTDLNTITFTDEFVEQICVEWADLGLYIEPPDERWREKK